MRTIWLIFGSLLLGLLGLRYFLPHAALGPAARRTTATPVVLISARSAAAAPARRDSIVRFALRQMGTPYVWAGTSPLTGFDCSGFIFYVFGRFGVATPHSTALLINAGRPVTRAQAQPGDIVVFTGTAEGSTTAGHAGIVISTLGETPLRFVHASSAKRESGVKISQVENSGYERRFMQVRRVLDGGAPSAVAVGASQPAATAATGRSAGAVVALPAAAPEVVVVPIAPLPARVAPLPGRLRRHASAKRATAIKRRPATKTSALKKPAVATHRTALGKPTVAAKKPVKVVAKHRLARKSAKTKRH